MRDYKGWRNACVFTFLVSALGTKQIARRCI